MQTTTTRARPLPIEGTVPSLAGATTWLNSQPLTPEGLRGNVVLVDFWTYTCINWQRTQPYIRAWAEKYKDQGLVVIGVHTPELRQERDVENVRRYLAEHDIAYPVAIDNAFTTWNRYGNDAWPAIYLIDKHGLIRLVQVGEGGYAETENAIERLLAER